MIALWEIPEVKLLQTFRAGKQMESSLGGWLRKDLDRETGKVDARVTDLARKSTSWAVPWKLNMCLE